jgi:hypothetical protein
MLDVEIVIEGLQVMINQDWAILQNKITTSLDTLQEGQKIMFRAYTL